MGLWLVLYLILHLIVNSQAALWLGDEGIGFVRLVNILEALPYLHVIEIVFLGIPFALHGYWGMRRIFTAKSNSFSSDGSEPSLKHGRSRAFTWQRLTSWVLLFGIIGHVVQMRFVQFPEEVKRGFEAEYKVYVTDDSKLKSIADQMCVKLLYKEGGLVEVFAPTPGKAMLLMVRETFKSPLMCVLYSIFVLAAAFHAFNGFWTSLITWGAVLSYRSQKAFLPVCWLGVCLLAFLGLAAIWGSYWLY